MTVWLVSLGVAILLASVPAVYAWRTRDARQPGADGPEITAVAALQEGVSARIRGVVAACEPLLTSKLGGQSCVGYQTFIFESFADADRWYPSVWGRVGWSSFLVTDETGTVAVKGRVKMHLDADGGPQELPAAGHALLVADGVPLKELWVPRKFKFRERLLRVGDRVSVVGRPAREGGAAASGGPPPRYAMTGTQREPVVVMDDDELVRALLTQPPPVAPIDAPRVHGPSRRAIAERETLAIATLMEDEPAKIRGIVSAREPLSISPVSGRPCIGYRITIERLGHPASTVVRREAWPSFFVADDSGTAAVEGPFSILLDPDSGGWADLPPSVYALLEEARVPVTGLFGRSEEFQFHETLLQVGDRVCVVGRPALRIDPAGQGSFREPPRLYLFQGSEEAPVALVDDDEPIG